MPVTNTAGKLSLDIEKTEADGQTELLFANQLPRKNGMGKDMMPIYEELGIKVKSESHGDPLFFDVELPIGWTIFSTEHSMWSELKNEKGEEVGSIFYKAAPYDRNAHFDLS